MDRRECTVAETKTGISRERELLELKERIFRMARLGKLLEISATLCRLSHDVVAQVLHHHTHFASYLHTPLTVAIMERHASVVYLLAVGFGVDLDKTVVLDTHGNIRDSALSAAARFGSLDTVNILLKSGADVNQETSGKKTALHRACRQGHLNIVKRLLREGARPDHVSQGGRTCLMEACKGDNYDVIEHLLQKGVDPNQKTAKSHTALHVTAVNNAVQAAALLLDHGAVMTTNDAGFTPLVEAILRKHSRLVSVMLRSSTLSRDDRINGMELWGALSCGDDTYAAFSCLKTAMAARYGDPSNIIYKPSRTPVAALGNVLESMTMEELESRKHDKVTLTTECLLIVEKNLGPDHVHTANAYSFLCESLSEQGRYHDAIIAWIHGRRAAVVKNDHLFDECIFSILCAVVHSDLSRKFPYFARALEVLTEDMEKHAASTDVDENACGDTCDLCLCLVEGADEFAVDNEEWNQLRDLVTRLVRICSSVCRERPILHRSLGHADEDAIEEEVQIFEPRLLSIVLACGADVDTVDVRGNTALHVVASCREARGPDKARDVASLLLEAGAHVDVRNNDGLTPLDLATSEDVRSLLQEYYPLSLKCLAAIVINRHKVPFHEGVPSCVQNFIKLHTHG